MRKDRFRSNLKDDGLVSSQNKKILLDQSCVQYSLLQLIFVHQVVLYHLNPNTHYFYALLSSKLEEIAYFTNLANLSYVKRAEKHDSHVHFKYIF